MDIRLVDPMEPPARPNEDNAPAIGIANAVAIAIIFFWGGLALLVAESRGVSVSIIVAEIQAQDRRTNLSSAIRLYVLEHACERCAVAEGRDIPHVRPEITANA